MHNTVVQLKAYPSPSSDVVKEAEYRDSGAFDQQGCAVTLDELANTTERIGPAIYACETNLKEREIFRSSFKLIMQELSLGAHHNVSLQSIVKLRFSWLLTCQNY